MKLQPFKTTFSSAELCASQTIKKIKKGYCLCYDNEWEDKNITEK